METSLRSADNRYKRAAEQEVRAKSGLFWGYEHTFPGGVIEAQHHTGVIGHL